MRVLFLVLSISFFSCASMPHKVVNEDAEMRAKLWSIEKRKKENEKKELEIKKQNKKVS